MQPDDRTLEYTVRNAERIHDRDFKGIEVHSKQIEAFSIAAMRAPALVAAGGVAAILGFYSANYARLEGHAAALGTFNAALAWLFTGLLLTLVSPGLAYFSQLAYSDALINKIHQWEPPYSVDTRRSKIAGRVGDLFRWCCVLSVLASVVSVAVGGVKFLDLVAQI